MRYIEYSRGVLVNTLTGVVTIPPEGYFIFLNAQGKKEIISNMSSLTIMVEDYRVFGITDNEHVVTEQHTGGKEL